LTTPSGQDAPGSLGGAWRHEHAPYLLAILALLIICFLCYRPGLSGPLLFDDFVNLTDITRYLDGEKSASAVILGNPSGPLGRPIAMASFLVDAELFGQDIHAAKRTNLIIHLVNGILLTVLLLLLGKTSSKLHLSSLAAVTLASFWLLQPMAVSTVLYLVQRMTLLSATFVLAGLIAFVHARSRLAPENPLSTLLLWVAVPMATVLAMLSKENGALLPLIALGLHLALPMSAPSSYQTRHLRWFFIVTLAAPAVAAVLLMAFRPESFFGLYALRDFTAAERMLTQARVLWSYVGSSFFPYTPSLSLFHDTYPVSRGIFSPASTAGAWLAWAATAILAFKLRRQAPGILVGLLLFLTGHALESTIFPLELYFEHRNYLPSAGLFIAAYAAIMLAARHLALAQGSLRAIAPLLVAAALLVSAGALTVRAKIWSTEESIFAHELKHNPSSIRVRSTLLARAVQSRDTDVAMAHIQSLEQTTEGKMSATLALWKLIVACVSTEPLPVDQYQQELSRSTVLPFTLYDHIAIRLIAQKVDAGECSTINSLTLARTIETWLDASVIAPHRPEIWATRHSTARLLAAGGDLDRATGMAEEAWNASGRKPGPGVTLLQLLLALDREPEAREVYRALRKHGGSGDRIVDEMLQHYSSFWGEAPLPETPANQSFPQQP
jgi:hypothetical protein